MKVPDAACPLCGLDDPAMTVLADRLVQAVVSEQPINRYHVIIVPRGSREPRPDSYLIRLQVASER